MDRNLTSSRRRFSALALAGLSACSISRAAELAFTPDSEAEVFGACLGESFSVDGSSIGLESLKIHPRSAGDRRPGGVRQESFSLLFQMQSGEPLVGGIHQVSHPALGRFPLFLSETRVDASAVGVRYEAIFN